MQINPWSCLIAGFNCGWNFSSHFLFNEHKKSHGILCCSRGRLYHAFQKNKTNINDAKKAQLAQFCLQTIEKKTTLFAHRTAFCDYIYQTIVISAFLASITSDHFLFSCFRKSLISILPKRNKKDFPSTKKIPIPSSQLKLRLHVRLSFCCFSLVLLSSLRLNFPLFFT